jgi:hypothetical protein
MKNSPEMQDIFIFSVSKSRNLKQKRDRRTPRFNGDMT